MNDVLQGIVTPELQDSLQKLRYGEEPFLRDLVSQLSLGIDAKLIALLQHRFYFTEHLLALKKFMLLGQGDFVTCLMDAVAPELKKRANQLYRHNLTGVLEGALRSSNAQYEPNYILDSVGIRLHDAAPGDSGWEVFSLDYAVSFPLNSVVHLDALAQYRVAFQMLWRLKRVEWTLATTWKAHSMFTHTHRAMALSARLKNVLHRCNLSRAVMMHVVNNLCAFLMFEVMETTWMHLEESLTVAKSLDDVIVAHDNYLHEVLDRALLTQQHEALNLQLRQLLQIVLRFCSLEENLLADMMASVARKRLARTAAEERTRLGKWGMDGAEDDVIGLAADSADGVPDYLVHRIDETVGEYRRQFDILLFMLREQGETAGEFVRHLTFRLDFNEFYSDQQQQQQQQQPQGSQEVPLHMQHPEYRAESFRFQTQP